MISFGPATYHGVMICRTLRRRFGCRRDRIPGKQIIDNGVRIFFADGTERKLESAQDALLMAISNFGAAFERERASERVRDKMFSKARSGHHTGGRVYGYDAVPVDGHIELRVNPAEAPAVRRLFELSAQGHGIKRLAGILNAEGIPGPKGSGRWSATGIRDMLRNDRYRGVLVFGRTTWEVRKGLRRKVQAPEAEWIRLEVPHLRIVPEVLWRTTHQRLEQQGPTGGADARHDRGRVQARHPDAHAGRAGRPRWARRPCAMARPGRRG